MNSELENDYNFKRLAQEGEKTWEDVFKRLIDELEKRGAKTPRKDMEWLFYNYYALPNSPALKTAGTNFFAASACSSMPLSDSMSGEDFSILSVLDMNTRLTSKGLGTGCNFSQLRSSKDTVNGQLNVTGGPVGFLKSFSSWNDNLVQGGMRRPASMGVLSVHHPDIEDWIDAKMIDGDIKCFNISVLLSDEFMRAVEQDGEYEIKWPKDGKIYKTEMRKAKPIWNKIISNSHAMAEPGIVYSDNMARDYFDDSLFDVNKICLNPCFSGESILYTKEGPRKMKDLVNERIEVATPYGYKEAKIFCSGNRETIKLFNRNNELLLECTPEHKIGIINYQSKLGRDFLEAKDTIGEALSYSGSYDLDSQVAKIIDGEKQDVYDFTIIDAKDELERCAFVDGILAHNCSEAILSYGYEEGRPWADICVLGSINLPKYKEVNLNVKRKIIKTLISVLNDIIDTQDYVLEMQKRGMQDINRKIGIGVAGLATVFATKGIAYGSEDCYDYTKELFEEMYELAKPEAEKFKNKSYFSIAPTSTLSNIFNSSMLGGCSYGIEPYFNLESIVKNTYGTFEKKEKILDIYPDAKIKTANELTWQEHMKPIYAITDALKGKHCLQSISKTINFKENLTKEELEECYVSLWKDGIKAVSIYRDGSRKDQVISSKESYTNTNGCKECRPSEIVLNNAPKRPLKLGCDIHRISVNKKQWLVFVGMLSDKPYELFLGEVGKIYIPKKYTKGVIGKHKGKYDLLLDWDFNKTNEENNENAFIIEDIVKLFDSKEYSALSRTISMSLRHGIPLNYIVSQLQKDGDITSANKVIARILKKYIKDNEKTGLVCPNCNSELFFVQGCPTCKCGYSKCG